MCVVQGKGSGGGGLRILPHKSWNVYGRDQQARVRADEAKHAVEQEKKITQRLKVQAERRIELLRQKAVKRSWAQVNQQEQQAEQQQQQQQQQGESFLSEQQKHANTHSNQQQTHIKRYIIEQDDQSNSSSSTDHLSASLAQSKDPHSIQDATGHINLFNGIEESLARSQQEKLKGRWDKISQTNQSILILLPLVLTNVLLSVFSHFFLMQHLCSVSFILFCLFFISACVV